MKPRKILVTGGAGFIAGCLAERLAQDMSNYVVIADNLSTGHLSNIPKSPHNNISFIKADVNAFEDISGIFYANKFDYVFHYAALVGVKRTLEHPVPVLTDIDGIRNVLNLSKNTGVRRVFYSSSSEVYGEPVEFPQDELTTPLNSRLPYAIVKNVGEAYMRSYFQEYGLEYTVFRFFNTYGYTQSEDFVMTKFINAALAGKNITIYGDGSQTRTFCHINDNIDATLRVLYDHLYVNDVVNIGSNAEISILELAQKIIQFTNSKSQLKHLPKLPEGDMTRRQPSVDKMLRILNRPLTTLDEGLKDVISAYSNKK